MARGRVLSAEQPLGTALDLQSLEIEEGDARRRRPCVVDAVDVEGDPGLAGQRRVLGANSAQGDDRRLTPD